MHVGNIIDRMLDKEIQRRIETPKKCLLTIKQKQSAFMEHMMKKEGSENSKFTGHTEDKKSRRKQ